MKRQNSQAGIVSILTVIFFMIFISILVVGFIKIMTDEQRQTTDNDLSSSALAAAQSGIEDGKRIILRCNDPTPPGQCNTMMNSGVTGDCDRLGSSNGITGPLGIDMNGDEALVGEGEFEQAYTCLTIKKDTEDIKKTLTEGKSEIVKLDVGAGGFTELTFTWKGSNGSFAVPGPSTLFPPRNAWVTGANTIPPMLRLQFIPYTAGNVNFDQSERESRTAFVKPSNAAASVPNIQTLDGRGATAGSLRTSTAPVTYATCPVLGASYECTKTIASFDATRSYYLRVSVMYAAETDLVITARNGVTPVTFKFVQPEIDVTGRANDVYRRVKARVSFEAPGVTYPEYAVESGTSICKRIIVADAANSDYLACP